MQPRRQPFSDWLRGEFVIKKVDDLQREILRNPHETNKPIEALTMAYEALTDEQKMTFILDGGAECLFHYQWHHTQQTGTGSHPETGQLPVLR